MQVSMLMRTSTDVLIRQCLAKALRRRRDRPSEQQAQLGQEGLPEGAPLLLQPAGHLATEVPAVPQGGAPGRLTTSSCA